MKLKYKREESDRVTGGSYNREKNSRLKQKNGILVRAEGLKGRERDWRNRKTARRAEDIPLGLLARKSMTRGAFSQTDVIVVISRMNISSRESGRPVPNKKEKKRRRLKEGHIKL